MSRHFFCGAAVVVGLLTALGINPSSAENGFLGLQVQGMATRAAAALGLSKPNGIMIRDVAIGGPGAMAGLRHGDVIVRFNGSNTPEFNNLIKAVGNTKPGQRIKVVISRNGKRQSITMRLGARPAGWEVTEKSFGRNVEIGITVAAINKAIRERFKYRWGVQGLAVTQVNPEKPAADILKSGDVITHVNLRPVSDPKQLTAAINKAKKERRRDILLLVENFNGYFYSVLSVNPGNKL